MVEMQAEDIYKIDWADNQLYLQGQMKNWIINAIRRQKGFHWRGGHDEGSYTCSWGNYYKLTGDEYVRDFLWWLRDSYVKWSKENYYHGFQPAPGDHNNHTFENAEEFIASLYDMDPTDEVSAGIMVDIAHHVGNWVEGIPEWYDWENHRIVAHWLGTKEVYDFPPYDFELAGHTRIGTVVIYAYHATKDPRYLQWCEDYANKWAGIIEESEGRIPMVTYPREITPEERMETYNFGRERVGDPYVGDLWASITTYVVKFLLQVYELTKNTRYIEASKKAIGMYDGVLEEEKLINMYIHYQEVTGDREYQAKLEKWYEKRILPSLETEQKIPDHLIIGQKDVLQPVVRFRRAFGFKGDDGRIILYTGPTADMYLNGYKVTGNLECLNRAMALSAAELNLVTYSTRDGREHGCASHRLIHGVGDVAADVLYKATEVDRVNYYNQDEVIGLIEEVAVICDFFDEENPTFYFSNKSDNAQTVLFEFQDSNLKIEAVENGEIIEGKSGNEMVKVELEPKEILAAKLELS